MSEVKEQNIRVAIVEDDEDVRDMLERVFKATDGFELAGSWPDMESALRFVKLNRPEVMLLDIGLPGMSGLEGATQLLKIIPNVKILMLTGRNAKEDVFNALRAGASGYITKGSSQAEILKSVRSVAEGNAALSPEIARTVVEVFRPSDQQYDLTRRELEILAQLCNGAVYKEIAASLFVEQSTVHFHLKNIYRKLGVSSKGEAIAKALHEKLVTSL